MRNESKENTIQTQNKHNLDTMVDKFVESGAADIALIAWLLVMVALSFAGRFGLIFN